MEQPTSNPQPFDERAALEKLEHLRQNIERYRLKRKAVSEEFDAFVRSFKTPQPAAGIQPRADETPEQRSPPAAPPANPEFDADVPLAPIPAAAPSRARVRTPALVGGALFLIAAGGWITWMVRTRAPEAKPAAPSLDTRAASPPASAPPAPARQPAASVSELTTSRRVWVRVIADGQRVVEGELPANARVPLTANKTVVIRAGNAGVVRLILRGRDHGVLGPEGAVVTRSFTVPSRAEQLKER